MIARPVTAALLALSLCLPASFAFAERGDSSARVTVATSQAPMRMSKRKARLAAEKALAQSEADRAALKQAVAEVSAQPKKGRIWCVPFARDITGVALRGNANTWWKQAADQYERGQVPKVGAVMNFSSSKSMPMGHVAVVSKVISEREVLIDHANWVRNRITTDVLAVDVSEKGDWSRVKVANSGGTLGRVNPVYGFIYQRDDI